MNSPKQRFALPLFNISGKYYRLPEAKIVVTFFFTRSIFSGVMKEIMFTETKYHFLSHRTYGEEQNTPTWQLLLVGGHPFCSQTWDVAGYPSFYQCLCLFGSYLGKYIKIKVITDSLIFVSILLCEFHQ